MFRRAKLMLDAVPAEVLDAAARTGLLVGRLALRGGRGSWSFVTVWSVPLLVLFPIRRRTGRASAR
ncbi:DUF5990 family protein [Streptomyces sp. NPDC001984]